MIYKTKKNLASALYDAYAQAENEIEKQKIKDNAYELGILLGESYWETVEMNKLHKIEL